MVLFTTAANQSSTERRRAQVTGYVMDNDSIRDAVTAWVSNPTSATATYGHISTWETGGVTDMTGLFCGYDCHCSSGCWCAEGDRNCNPATQSFNDAIGAWDTSGVTTMQHMFFHANSFNQPLNDWRVDKVTTTYCMFCSANS